MKVTLNHDLKVKLLEAIKLGTLDTHIFPSEFDTRTDEEIYREMQRLERPMYDEDELLEMAEIIRKCGAREISRSEYDEMMVAFKLKIRSEEYLKEKGAREMEKFKRHSEWAKSRLCRK